MSRINNNYYLRYGLVVLITLAFVVATYFIVNPKTSCEAQGKVNDPTPGSNRCLKPCKPDRKDYRCLTDKCKARYDINTGAVVCSDCEIGKIPLKDEGTNTYNCVPECNEDKPCRAGETCKQLSQDETGSPYYCAKNLYKCVKDVGNRGHYCKAVTPGSGGVPLNECLNKGTTDRTACSCNHKQGYALNSENTACSTTACTLDGLNGWGSNQPTSTNNSNKSYYVDPIVDEKNGTCYAMDEKGLLLDPKVDESKTCSIKTTAEECHDTNSDGWKCKWLPDVKCTRKKYNDAKCDCVSGCYFKYGEHSSLPFNGVFIDACKDERCIISSIDSRGNITSKPQLDCAGFQYKCTQFGSCPFSFAQDPKGVRDVYSIPPTNCLTKKGNITKPKSILKKQCPYFFNKDGTAKTNEQIGGYNPADAYLGLTGTKRLHPFPDNNDLSLYALILALLIVAILVFTVRQR